MVDIFDVWGTFDGFETTRDTPCPAHDVGDTVTGRDFGVVRRKSDVTYRSLLSSIHRSPVFATTGAIRFLCEWSFCVTQAFWHLSRYVVSWYYTPHTTITIRADLGPGTRRRERQRTLHGEIPCHFPNRYGFRGDSTPQTFLTHSWIVDILGVGENYF